jgi:hypothetical protein
MSKESIESTKIEISNIEAEIERLANLNEKVDAMLVLKLNHLKTKLKWDESGLLEGLKGKPNKNLASLLECFKSSKIK